MIQEQAQDGAQAAEQATESKLLIDDEGDEGDEGDIEEGRAAYRPGGFHPVYIGDVFNGRYRVLNKIGYGRYSTVWLVEDITWVPDGHHSTRFYALKVLSAECYHTANDIFEREILKHLRDRDRSHVGYASICHLVDDFEHNGGPNGTHVCLVFELMGETLSSFGTLFAGHMVPNRVMRKFVFQMLAGLEYAHDSNVVHTDIKPSNIFVKFRDLSLVETKYLKKVPVPEQDRNATKYPIIPSTSLRNYYFTRADSSPLDFDVVLGDWGVSSWTTNHLCELIQPVALRAPEVLIGAPWDATADWWNLGAVVLEVFRVVRMFSGRVGPDGHYELKEHLREIVDLFGPFPRALLESGRADIVERYFDAGGNIKDAPPMDRPRLESDDFMADLQQEERVKFVAFLRALMAIDPACRPSTMDLLRQPWIGLAL